MEIKILKNNSKLHDEIRINFNTIRSFQITDEEYHEYQEVFGKIVSESKNNDSYIFSDLLNREDGTTHLLDSIVKLLECLKLIDETSENLIIYNIDKPILISIRNYCISKGIKVKYYIVNLLLNTYINYLFFFARILRTLFRNSFLVFYAKLNLKSSFNNSIKKVFISYFDYRSISNGKFTDPFFSPLQNQLDLTNTPYAVINIIMFGSFQQGIKSINSIRKLERPNITTLFNLIPNFGILTTFIRFFKLRVRLTKNIIFFNYDISDLIREKLQQEFFSTSLQHTLERIYVIKLLEYKHIEVILYPFENFAWEKKLCLEKSRIGSNTSLIGFQHTSFSLKLQHHFPSQYEKLMPIFPTKILTTGMIPKEVLSKYGSFPENLLQIGCALRHKYIFNLLSNYKSRDKINGKIAFSFSFDVTRYSYIIDNIKLIFGGKDIDVFLKFHPLNKGYQFKSEDFPKNIINKTDHTWFEIMEQIDLLLYEGNSLCIDALANNIPAIYFPFTGDIYNTDQLYNYESKLSAGNDVSTYYFKTLEILNKNLKNDDLFFIDNSKYVQKYFHPISSEAIQKFLK